MTTALEDKVHEMTVREVMDPQAREALSKDLHEAIMASWRAPEYDRGAKAPLSSKPVFVGLTAGVLGLIMGAGVGYWANEVASDPGYIVVPGIESAPTDGTTLVLPPSTVVPE
jgi:hypothetical protein